jgi:hypothetical protein
VPGHTEPLEALPAHAAFADAATPAGWCQRWRHGRHCWVPSGQPGAFHAEKYRVKAIGTAEAKAFIGAHHYESAYPADRFRFGLFTDTGTGPELIGVAVFGIPMQAKVLTKVLPDWEPYRQTLELSRFTILGDPLTAGADGGIAPANAESWFLARCHRHLAEQDVRGIVAFSDPVPRRTHNGALIMPGHVGIIYQASNAVYTGRGTRKTLIVLPDGTSLPGRALSKLRNGESGHAAIERRLIALGAPARTGSDPAAWLRDALEAVGARRVAHPGCHRFVMATHPRFRRRMRIALPALAYPKPGPGWPGDLE